MQTNVILSLGSNIGNREFNINRAITAISSDPQNMLVNTSNFYETSPVGNVEQKNFINVAINVATNYEPEKLLAKIHQIEADLHRTRDIHWGPRTIDVDIVFWGDQTISDSDLVVPHLEAFNRLFVLVPSLEVLPADFNLNDTINQRITELSASDQSIKLIKQNKRGDQEIMQSVRTILANIGEDPDRAGLLETPDRVQRMYAEIFSTTGQEKFQDYKLFDSENPDSSKMIMMRNIPFYSMCEHHMMPFFGKAHVAYIPTNGKIIGLSKIPRLVDFVTHKLGLQEKVTDDIATQLNKILNPQGVAVVVDARHMCVEMRGVKKTDSSTRTFSFSGLFKEDSNLQAEFLNSIGDLNDQNL